VLQVIHEETPHPNATPKRQQTIKQYWLKNDIATLQLERTTTTTTLTSLSCSASCMHVLSSFNVVPPNMEARNTPSGFSDWQTCLMASGRSFTQCKLRLLFLSSQEKNEEGSHAIQCNCHNTIIIIIIIINNRHIKARGMNDLKSQGTVPRLSPNREIKCFVREGQELLVRYYL